MRTELVTGVPAADYGIWLESTKIETVRRLEDILSVNQSTSIHKSVHIEIDRQECSRFDYYWIEPQPLQWRKQVFLDMTPRVCQQVDGCRWGMKILHPVRIAARVCNSLLFGRIIMDWEMSVNLVVSAELRRLFDANGFRGLDYHPSDTVGADDGQKLGPDCFVAKINHEIAEEARAVLPGANYCRVHSTFLDAYVFDPVIRRSEVEGFDFIAVHRVRAGAEVYSYSIPRWFVSRRVLELLWRQKVPGLRRVTLWLNEKFKPVVVV